MGLILIRLFRSCLSIGMLWKKKTHSNNKYNRIIKKKMKMKKTKKKKKKKKKMKMKKKKKKKMKMRNSNKILI